MRGAIRNRNRSHGIAHPARLLPVLAALAICGLPALATVPNQVVLSPDSPWLINATTGQGLLMCGAGDPEGFLYRGSRQSDGTRGGSGADQSQIISALTAAGANTIYMIGWRGCPAGAGGPCGGDGDSSQMPMTCTGNGSTQCNDDSDCSGAGGTCQVDADVIAQWRGWFDQMKAASPQILIYFFFWDDDSAVPANWSEDGGAPGSVERRYYEGVVNALEDYPNLIWVIAEEYPDEFDSSDIVSIAGVIRAADDHDHLIGVHQPPTGGPFAFSGTANIEHFAAQYSGPDTASDTAWHNELRGEFEAAAAGGYHVVMSEVAHGGIGGGDDYRRNAWAGLSAGVGVLALGWWSEGVGTSSCNGGACQSPPATTDLEVCGHALEFFDGINPRGLRPDDGRVSGSTDYVLADPGRRTYVGYTDSYSGSMGLGSIPAGTYVVRWMDTVSGTITTEPAVAHGGGTFTRSRAGSGTEVVVSVHPSSSTEPPQPPQPPEGVAIR